MTLIRDMSKSKLVEVIAKKTGLSASSVEMMVNAFTETVTDQLQHGSSVSIKGFGTFETKYRQARNGLDPRNLTPIAIPAKVEPIFRCGKLFKEDVIHAHMERLQ